LADRAKQVLADFGYRDAPSDSDQSFIVPPDFPRWLIETDATPNRWNKSRVAMGPALLFWWRGSPRDLEPSSPSATVSPTDPAMTNTGESLVILDTRGRLVEFRRVPPQRESESAPATEPRWDAAFQAAGLDRSGFTP